MTNLYFGLSLLFVAQCMNWLSTNGQFINENIKNHPFLVSLFFGTITNYFFIYATKLCVPYFDNQVWPVRIFTFCFGTLSFSLLTWMFLNEAFTAKTIVCIFLSLVIVGIQIFWK